MGRLIIEGARPLYGTVYVSGSKNAALPVIFASVITRGVSEIINLPRISDVECALSIIEGFGASITRSGNTTYIDTRELSFAMPSEEQVSRLRASTYLIGACLLRFGEAYLQSFGGCNFSHRPIDMHLASARLFGAEIEGDRLVLAKGHAAHVYFEKRSVGATVNTLILAAGTPGESTLRARSLEPHIDTLIEYLRSAGAVIDEQDGVTHVTGGSLHGGRVFIPGDMIEAGTYLSAAAMTGGAVRVLGAEPRELSAYLELMRAAGATVELVGSAITLKGRVTEPIRLRTAPYPGFPTDLQPIMAPIMAVGGGGMITDNVFEGRFGYLSELSRLGLSFTLLGNTATVHPSELHSGRVRVPDLRGGAALVNAALCAEGQSIIDSADILGRGYEDLVMKLSGIGAEIMYVN